MIDIAQVGDANVNDADERRSFRLPPGILRAGNRLLDQQFWLWGCDIRRPEGNLLSYLGFEKVKEPGATGLTISQYRAPLHLSRSLALWGFGICLIDREYGSVFVPRSGLRPRFCGTPICTDAAWVPAWFDRLPQPCAGHDVAACFQLVRDLLDWIAWYEGCVLDIAGPAYRRHALDAWKRPVIDPTPLPQQWRDLGRAIREGALGAA